MNSNAYEALKQKLVANGVNNLENKSGCKITSEKERSIIENMMGEVTDQVLSDILTHVQKTQKGE